MSQIVCKISNNTLYVIAVLPTKAGVEGSTAPFQKLKGVRNKTKPLIAKYIQLR